MFILHRNRLLLFYILSPLGGGREYKIYDKLQICKCRYTPNITLVFATCVRMWNIFAHIFSTANTSTGT
jgi:hypothetical protein